MLLGNIKHILKSALKMDTLKENAALAKQAILDLKQEITIINNQYNVILARELQAENEKLISAINEAKDRLVSLEEKNGVKQIPVPNQTSSTKLDSAETISNETEPQPKSVKKDKKAPKSTSKNDDNSAELPIDIGRLDLRVGKVVSVEKHPDADSLYHLKVACGETNPRTVCSGLVKHATIEQLQSRDVLLLCNLKPVKMRGILSEAMIMCASTADKIEVLLPPENCAEGDQVHCEGYKRQPDAIMAPKKKIFETVQPNLHTNDKLQACYKGVLLTVPGKGPFLAESLKNSPIK